MIEERKLQVLGIETNYKIAGEGTPLLILHGWGGSSDSWQNVIEILEKKKIKLIVPDFPGFGKSKTPPIPWTLQNFVDWLKVFLENLKIDKFFLLGHSFGGRVAIKFSLNFPEKIKALILVDSAGIKQKWGPKETLIFYLALLGNAIFAKSFLRRFKDKARNLFYRFFRDRDYGKAKKEMKETMKRVICEDLLPVLEKIKTKTFIVWGEKDNIVPLKYGKILKEKIKNSELIIFPNVRHSPHLEIPEELSQKLIEVLKKNDF
jgi:pimeloyl-ACP methyl ester carboxylesterase